MGKEKATAHKGWKQSHELARYFTILQTTFEFWYCIFCNKTRFAKIHFTFPLKQKIEKGKDFKMENVIKALRK